jgi:hypothetical protein
MEILDKLEEECIVDEDDEDYQEGKMEVKEAYGPM